MTEPAGGWIRVTLAEGAGWALVGWVQRPPDPPDTTAPAATKPRRRPSPKEQHGPAQLLR